ncbi:hypothetical protein MOU99_004242 [Vibrio vulnificus]|nr:hypothetical protein [Vibrio vulnificus]EIZ1051869.1 hypothetical protein [Vibrio vulnificus]
MAFLVCSEFCVYGVVQKLLYGMPHYLTGRYVLRVKMKQSVFMSLVFLTGCAASQAAPIEVLSYEVDDNHYTLIAISEKNLTSSNVEIDSIFVEKINELCPHGYLVSEPTEDKGHDATSLRRRMEHYIRVNNVKIAHSYSKSVSCTL